MNHLSVELGAKCLHPVVDLSYNVLGYFTPIVHVAHPVHPHTTQSGIFCEHTLQTPTIERDELSPSSGSAGYHQLPSSSNPLRREGGLEFDTTMEESPLLNRIRGNQQRDTTADVLQATDPTGVPTT